MALARRACLLCKGKQSLSLSPLSITSTTSYEQIRFGTGKHYHPKYKHMRNAKFFKTKFPDFDLARRQAGMTAEEQRAENKRLGYNGSPRVFRERDILNTETGRVIDAYIPPEGDGVASLLSTTKAKQVADVLGKKGKSYTEARSIKKYDSDFDVNHFPEEALEIYKEASTLLQDIKGNKKRLFELVTETAYPNMTWKLEDKTVRWEFIQSLEPARVVHVRTSPLMEKTNIFAQVTVRFHTKQKLAVYDRFGRLMYGGDEVRDCLEYVVFEKHVTEEYGRWRMHFKLVPDWMPPSEPVYRTVSHKSECSEEPEEAEEAALEATA